MCSPGNVIMTSNDLAYACFGVPAGNTVSMIPAPASMATGWQGRLL